MSEASSSKSTTKSADTPKASAPSGSAPSGDKSSNGDASSAKSSSSGGGSSRPISYFSSISTNEYRDGWDSIFGNSAPEAGKSAAEKPKRAAPRRKSTALPVTIELTEADLDAAAREALEQAFRRKAKAERLNYDSLSRKARRGWRLRCEFSG